MRLWLIELWHGWFPPPSPEDPFGYDSRQDGLYVINRWSPNRLLTPDRLVTNVDRLQRAITWFDTDEWTTEVAKQAKNQKAGDVCYLVDYRVDHQESPLNQEFYMTLAPCDYSEHFATVALLEKYPEIHKQIKQCIEDNPKEYARQACPSLIAINVVVLSDEGNFLAIERSTAVDTARGLWTVGPFETMTLSRQRRPGDRREDLFELAERCLWEELGLKPQHYGEIVISWIGFLASIVRGHVVAQVKLTITEEEAKNRILTEAEHIQETETVEWMPFNKKNISRIIANRESALDGREWIDQARLALQETWRMRSVLNLERSKR